MDPETNSQINKDWLHRHKLFLATLVIVIGGAGLLANWQLEQMRKNINTDFPTHQNASNISDTSNWKTYTNTEYGFEFEYPSNPLHPTEISYDNKKKQVQIEFWDNENNEFITDGYVSIRTNTDHLDLKQWFLKEVDPGNFLIKNQIYAFKSSVSGDSYVLTDKPVPSEWDGGPISAGFLTSPNINYVLEFNGSQDAGGQRFKKNLDQLLSTFKFTKLGSVSDSTSGLKKYSNTKYGFEFEFPNTWKFDEVDFDDLDVHINNIESDDAPDCDSGFVGMEIQAGGSYEGKFKDFVLSQVSDGYSLGPGGKITSMQIGGNEAYQTDFSGWDGGCSGPGYFISMEHNKYIYIFSGAEKESDLKFVDQVLYTFRFLK